MAQAFDLGSAVERLYTTFASYPLPDSTDPCWHCHTEEDEAKLHSKSLRELGSEDLRTYAGDALLVWGDERVFKHFLPRIFELVLKLTNLTLELDNPEIIFSRLRYGNWRSWPAEEQKAIEDYLHACWHHVLGDPPSVEEFADIESWLCSIAQGEANLGPYLSQWLADSRLSASLALSSFLLSSTITHDNRQGRNAFWENCETQYQQLRAWVRTKPVAEKLKLAELAASGTELANEFASARWMCEQDGPGGSSAE
jgi:hypothetical protein